MAKRKRHTRNAAISGDFRVLVYLCGDAAVWVDQVRMHRFICSPDEYKNRVFGYVLTGEERKYGIYVVSGLKCLSRLIEKEEHAIYV